MVSACHPPLWRSAYGSYGEPKKGVRVKPSQPIPYTFKVLRHDIPGDLTVGYAPRDDTMHQAITVRITRMNPD
jgi:hypothetical protein